MPSAKQHLEQKVCSVFGWSTRYFKRDPDGCWAVEVRVGVGEPKCFVFVSSDCSPPSELGTKQGCNAAAAMAIAGLHGEQERELAKPTATLSDVFGAEFGRRARIVDGASEVSWREFWALAPRVVGIDVEGNLNSQPILVQVAVQSLVVLEAPARSGLSPDLQRLLDDTSIIKVFCDGTTHADKRCLGLPAEVGPGVADLEDIAAERAGATAVRRGLTRILGLALPELGVRIKKAKPAHISQSDVAIFTAIEQGRRPQLSCLQDLPMAAQHYAALDAWVTLQAYQGLVSLQEPTVHSSTADSMPAVCAQCARSDVAALTQDTDNEWYCAACWLSEYGEQPPAQLPVPAALHTLAAAGVPCAEVAGPGAGLRIPAKPYWCEICVQGFNSQTQLAQHQIVHYLN